MNDIKERISDILYNSSSEKALDFVVDLSDWLWELEIKIQEKIDAETVAT